MTEKTHYAKVIYTENSFLFINLSVALHVTCFVYCTSCLWCVTTCLGEHNKKFSRKACKDATLIYVVWAYGAHIWNASQLSGWQNCIINKASVVLLRFGFYMHCRAECAISPRNPCSYCSMFICAKERFQSVHDDDDVCLNTHFIHNINTLRCIRRRQRGSILIFWKALSPRKWSYLKITQTNTQRIPTI